MTTKTLLTTAAILAAVSSASAQNLPTGAVPYTGTWSLIGRPSLIEKETPFEKAKLDFEVANRAYNAKKVRTRAEYNYVMSLRAKYAVEYKRMMMPPSEYDRPYTGNLTIERVADPAAITTICPTLVDRVGCARVPTDLSWCKVYIVSDAFIAKSAPEWRKQSGYSYENFLRHEIAHCNGWPADHPH